MNVFISWSGDRSRAVASVIAELLPDVVQHVRPWMSAHDIDAGARWTEALNRELESSNFGILCLTPENLAAPWLLFEAGSLAKKIADSRVVPYRFQLNASDVPFPLAQFQGVNADEDGTRKLVHMLNQGLSDPMDASRLTRIFDRWWPDVKKRLDSINESEAPKATKRPDRELFEEMLGLLRNIGNQGLRSSTEVAPDPEAFGDGRVPKSAVWKTVHDVGNSAILAMSDADLHSYKAALDLRWNSTSSRGEEDAIEGKQRFVEQELLRRKSEQGVKEPQDRTDSAGAASA